MRLSLYSEIGKRELNEDFITYRQNIYVLCDGVGGAKHGEVASRFVAEKLADYLDSDWFDDASDLVLIQNILKRIQIELNDRLSLFPDENGMGTTLAAILINKGRAFVIHIGDSRVYYVRPSERSFWCTTDHSVVSELISSGLITEDEAFNHPMKNRITRAIQSNSEDKTTKAEINCISNIKVGDLILLCSDGVLESISGNALLETLYNQNCTVDDKIEKVKYACKGVSNDNNSAILLEVETLDEFRYDQTLEVCFPNIELFNVDILSEDKNKLLQGSSLYNDSMKNRRESRPAANRILYIVSIAIITFLILIAATYTFSFLRRHKAIFNNEAHINKTENLNNKGNNISDSHSIKVEALPKSL